MGRFRVGLVCVMGKVSVGGENIQFLQDKKHYAYGMSLFRFK